MDLHPQRAAPRAQSLTKARRLNRIRHNDDDRRKRLLRQQPSNALDELLGLAVSSRGEEESSHSKSSRTSYSPCDALSGKSGILPAVFSKKPSGQLGCTFPVVVFTG